jgi:hypothetical protein
MKLIIAGDKDIMVSLTDQVLQHTWLHNPQKVEMEEQGYLTIYQ